MTTALPLFYFSMAGLYSAIENTLVWLFYPICLDISEISSVVKPKAGDGWLAPENYDDLIDERSRLLKSIELSDVLWFM